jgi:IS1 family transposase
MVSDLLFHELLLLALLWLVVLSYWAWSRGHATTNSADHTSAKRATRHAKDPKPFAGLTRRPLCPACEPALESHLPPPSIPPPRIVSTRGCPRTVDTQRHCCPHSCCAYYGWTGLGNLRANGHPSGGPWRQFHCVACRTYFLETHGTPLHGKRVAPERLVWAVGALAEGLGIRAVARVFEVDPNTVLAWVMEVADHATAFSRYFLHDVQATQVQLDELFALLSAVKAGEVSDTEAMQCLSRSPHWVWVAIDPVSKLLLAIDSGDRTLALAQRLVHQVVQVLAPDCVPLFLTDGFREYTMALLAHFGQWVQPPRRQAADPMPTPRWMPIPELRYAQVVKTYRCRRLVRVSHRVVFGTLTAVKQVLTPLGWHINTAFVERVNLTIRQHVAPVGRRVITLCKGEAGARQQLALYHVYYNFCLPHASLRRPLPQPEPANGSGSAKLWWPCTPAMAAGLTNHVWTLREVCCSVCRRGRSRRHRHCKQQHRMIGIVELRGLGVPVSREEGFTRPWERGWRDHS